MSQGTRAARGGFEQRPRRGGECACTVGGGHGVMPVRGAFGACSRGLAHRGFLFTTSPVCTSSSSTREVTTHGSFTAWWWNMKAEPRMRATASPGSVWMRASTLTAAGTGSSGGHRTWPTLQAGPPRQRAAGVSAARVWALRGGVGGWGQARSAPKPVGLNARQPDLHVVSRLGNAHRLPLAFHAAHNGRRAQRHR